jgi:hypothetical protein
MFLAAYGARAARPIPDRHREKPANLAGTARQLVLTDGRPRENQGFG